MANEASFDRDPGVWREPTRGKAGTADAHARGGDLLGAARKIEKVMQYDAFAARRAFAWCAPESAYFYEAGLVKR